MKINRILIRGYRSLKEIDWKPGSLNVVIGPNGTGKSNLLRFFELLGAASTGNLSRYIQKAGGIKPLLWDGKVDSFSFRLEISLPALNNDHWEDEYTYEVLFRQTGYGGDYRVESEDLTVQNQSKPMVNSEPEKLLYRNKQKIIIYDDSGGEMDMPENVVSHEELLLVTAANPFSGIKQINVFQEALSSFAVYHDLYVHQDSLIRQPTVTRYENTVAADGQNLVSVLHTLYTGERHFKNAVDSAMRAAFGHEYEELVFPPASDQRVQLRIRWSSLDQEQSAADLSDGTLYFLLLMTILNNPRPPVLIAIDEPETGLHPSMLLRFPAKHK